MIEPVVIGSAVLYRGDCLKWMSVIPDGSVDMILCDLPYGTTACKWDTVIPFEPLWAQYRRIAKKNAAIVLTASQPFTSALVMSAPRMFRHEWIWRKEAGSNFATVKFGPMKEHESVLVFSSERANYYPIPQERVGGRKGKETTSCTYQSSELYAIKPNGVFAVSAKRCPSSVQPFNRERGLHPTQKPVALMEYLIRTYTNEGETVLDNCMGSGTTGVACVNTGRNFIGIERDEKYFQIAADRIAESQRGQSRMFT
jgi:site-specific DNA-methyltransferase (adenine-specific)